MLAHFPAIDFRVPSAFTLPQLDGTPVEHKITQLYGDSKGFDEIPWLGKFDLILVDGSHAYSYVRNDREKALRMLAEGGMILWHDYKPLSADHRNTHGVRLYLDELSQTLPLKRIYGTSLVAYRTIWVSFAKAAARRHSSDFGANPGGSPNWLNGFVARWRRRSLERRYWANCQREYSGLSIAETFDRVYATHLWGGSQADELHSGAGSRGRLALEYCALMQPEIKSRGIRSLADLGCGDFAIGGCLAAMIADYTGIDIVQRVIDVNQSRHAAERCRFFQADITNDPLPPADAAILRQVLQHLSNVEIRAALHNVLRTYSIVFVTEHISTRWLSRPNLDMVHSPATRVARCSGVYIDRPPFNLAAKVVGDIKYMAGEVFRTWVITATRLASCI
jgi:SAM-dependent methyltransferase